MGNVPRRIRVGTDRAGVFDHRDDMYAVRVRGSDAAAGSRARIVEGPLTAFAVYEERTRTADRSADTLPVYSAGQQGPLAVPTGRVFVRFTEGIRAETRREDLMALGFTLESVPSYAPNAAWLALADGTPADALERLEAVAALPDVAHVEPQLVIERILKR
jgi:hypothetical protein